MSARARARCENDSAQRARIRVQTMQLVLVTGDKVRIDATSLAREPPRFRGITQRRCFTLRLYMVVQPVRFAAPVMRTDASVLPDRRARFRYCAIHVAQPRLIGRCAHSLRLSDPYIADTPGRGTYQALIE